MNQMAEVLNLSAPRAIAKFAIPTILSQLVTLIYNLADTFFVGHTNDPAQVAALTLSFPLFMMIIMVSNLFGIGANSFIARALGQGDRERASTASTFAFYGSIGGILVVSIVLAVFMRPILAAIGAVTPESYAATKAYLSWTVIYGGVPSVAAMMLGHLIRAEGNTKQASIGMALGGFLNIGLDAVFVSMLGLGAAGAGIATCISNVISMLYLYAVLRRTRDSVIDLRPSNLRFERYIVKQVILVGIPAAAIIVLGSSANAILTHYMSDYGDVSIAAYGITQKIGTVGIQITVGLSQGIMPLLGYCYGAGEKQHLKDISRWSFILLGVYAAACIGVVMGFADSLVRLFISEPDTVEKAVRFLRIWFFCAPGMCFTNLFSSIFQAMGKWIHSLVLSIIRQVALLIPLLAILSRLVGEMGLICAQPVSDTISLLVGIGIYISLMKQLETE